MGASPIDLCNSVFIHALLESCSWFSQLLTKISSLYVSASFSQTVFGAGARGLECNLLSAYTIQTVTGAKISVKLEGTYLFLKFSDFLVRFP